MFCDGDGAIHRLRQWVNFRCAGTQVMMSKTYEDTPWEAFIQFISAMSFPPIWLAETLEESSQRYVALKICIADAGPNHELEIFNKLSRTPPVPPNVVQLLDHFSLQGPNGVHTVLVQNVLGSFMEFVRPPTGPGRKLVRILCRDVAVGLAALHRQGIVHGDLHAGNVGIFLPGLNNHPLSEILDYFNHPDCTIVLPTTRPAHPGTLPPYLLHPISVIDYMVSNDKHLLDGPLQAQIMDLGNAIIVNEQTRPACTPSAVCAPELIFERVTLPANAGSPPTQASDIWSLGCTIYELVFGWGLFYFAGRNDTLLGKMATLCGEVPQGWKGYWESREQLRSLSISQETADAEWNSRLEHVTKEPYEDVKGLFALLRSMLIIDPKRRPSAEEVLKHSWFTHDGTA